MKTVGIYYYNKDNNFGDVLNEYIPERLFNCKIIKQDVYKAEATFIGSILSPFLTEDKPNLKLPELHIWGSGFIRATSPKRKFLRKIKVHAVRGKYTLDRLVRGEHINPKGIALGDPGLLCSRLFTNLDITKEYDWGIIPHYIDKGDELLKKFKLPNSIILDIQEKPEIFIQKLVKCKKIISGAMHGLIAADSFCIPSIRMILSDKIKGGDYKYNDYYSAFGITKHNRLDLRTIKHDITEVEFNYTITPDKVNKIQEDLIKSFPYA